MHAHTHAHVQIRKVLIIADIAVSGVWTFMWFVAFCYTADQRRQSDYTGLPLSTINCMNSVVAFSFFSILIWVSLFIYLLNIVAPTITASN